MHIRDQGEGRNSMAHLMATQSVLEFGSRGTNREAKLFASLADCVPVECRWRSQEPGIHLARRLTRSLARASTCTALLRVWIAKDFIVMNLIFVQTAPFHRPPPTAPTPPAGTRRTERYVPMQTCCTEYLEGGSKGGSSARSSAVLCPGWLPVIQ